MTLDQITFAISVFATAVAAVSIIWTAHTHFRTRARFRRSEAAWRDAYLKWRRRAEKVEGLANRRADVIEELLGLVPSGAVDTAQIRRRCDMADFGPHTLEGDQELWETRPGVPD